MQDLVLIILFFLVNSDKDPQLICAESIILSAQDEPGKISVVKKQEVRWR